MRRKIFLINLSSKWKDGPARMEQKNHERIDVIGFELTSQ